MTTNRADFPWTRLHEKVVEHLRTWERDVDEDSIADDIVNDAIDSARGLVHSTCFAFGHLWPEPPTGWFRWFKTDWSRRCSACGVHRIAVEERDV